MRENFDNLDLEITNLFNGDVAIIRDFYKFSEFTRECMVNDYIQPMLLKGINFSVRSIPRV